MKTVALCLATLLTLQLQAQITLDSKTINDAVNTVNKTTGTTIKVPTASKTTSTTSTSKTSSTAKTTTSSLTSNEMIEGLKEALKKGTNNSTTKASALDGFYKNSLIKIPFPPEMAAVEKKLRALGMGAAVDKFIVKMNRAAEDASKKAAPIFVSAITSMTISDAATILKGGNNAATNYLNNKTNAQLTTAMTPSVKESLSKVQILNYWAPLAKKYNAIPGVKKVNPDLNKYVTQRTVDGLFKLIAVEEQQIRTNPAARTTDILKKVFGM